MWKHKIFVNGWHPEVWFDKFYQVVSVWVIYYGWHVFHVNRDATILIIGQIGILLLDNF